jgi:hypothetical protein
MRSQCILHPFNEHNTCFPKKKLSYSVHSFIISKLVFKNYDSYIMKNYLFELMEVNELILIVFILELATIVN